MLTLAILITIFIGISIISKVTSSFSLLLNNGSKAGEYECDGYNHIENGISAATIMVMSTLSIAWRAFAIAATWILYRGI